MACEKVLTIGIPTFNRSNSLERLIKDLQSQILNSRLAEQIEILVSDNNSTDRTQALVKAFIHDNPSIKIIFNRNKNNLGSDANFLKVLSLANTRFCWIFSDDDSILDGSLKILVDTLKQSDPAVGFVCTNYYIDTSSNLTGFHRVGNNSYANLSEFSLESNISFSMITACIFNKEVVKKHLDKFENYLNTGYPHLFWLIICAQDNISMTLIREPLFRVNSQSVREKRLSGREVNDQEFYMNAHLSFVRFMKELSQFERRYTGLRLAIKRVRIVEDENINQIMYHKMCFGYKYVQKYPKYIVRMGSMLRFSPIFYFLHIPLLILPAFVSRLGIPCRWWYLSNRAKLKRMVLRLWAA